MVCQNTKVRIKVSRMPKDMIYQEIGDHVYDMEVTSKILAGFSVGMMVSYISFAAMLLVVEMEVFFLTGNLIIPGMSWLIIMLLIAPSFSLVAIAVTVRSSAKAIVMLVSVLNRSYECEYCYYSTNSEV